MGTSEESAPSNPNGLQGSLHGPIRFEDSRDSGAYVLKRSVPKTLAFAFGSRLRSKTQRSKTQRSKTLVLGRGLPNGKPQERLRFRDLHG